MTWTNTGDLAHTATDEGHAWDTGPIPSGGSASVTFNTPGTYTYICQPHPWMFGQLVVTEAPPDQHESAPRAGGENPNVTAGRDRGAVGQRVANGPDRLLVAVVSWTHKSTLQALGRASAGTSG